MPNSDRDCQKLVSNLHIFIPQSPWIRLPRQFHVSRTLARIDCSNFRAEKRHKDSAASEEAQPRVFCSEFVSDKSAPIGRTGITISPL